MGALDWGIFFGVAGSFSVVFKIDVSEDSDIKGAWSGTLGLPLDLMACCATDAALLDGNKTLPRVDKGLLEVANVLLEVLSLSMDVKNELLAEA